MKTKHQNSKERGVIAIVTLLGITTFALAIVITLTDLALEELKMANAGNVIDDSFYAAEAGLNQGLYRMIQSSGPADYNTTINGINVDISVKAYIDPADPDAGLKRTVISQATGPQGNIRTVQVLANTDSFAGGFDYAVQGGTGGVYLDNNSKIIGDIYSNGFVKPASPGATGEVFGNTWSATASGLVDKVKVHGDVHSHSISRSTIDGDAYYFNSDPLNGTVTIDTDTEVNGAACNPTPHSRCHPGSTDPGTREFPITPSQVEDWKLTKFTAADEVSPDPANCPASKDDGSFYCVQSGETLDQKHILGNLYVGNGATLTLSGDFLWVDGDIIFDNNGTVQVQEEGICKVDGNGDGDIDDPEDVEVFNSPVVIADGKIDVNNNYTFTGCMKNSTVVSAIILISTRDEGVNPSLDTGKPDIYSSNNSTSIIFAAINGLLKVKNGSTLNAAAAHTLFLEPNSTVTFNPYISNFVIGSGGGEDIGTSPGTWREL